jgi:hypothetical protein
VDRIIFRVVLAAVLVSPLAIVTGCVHEGRVNTARRVSDPESTKNNWLGGQPHDALPVYNADGSTSVGSQTTTSRNGTDTTVRERTTTSQDGSVRKDRETSTSVEGADNRTSETSNSPVRMGEVDVTLK